MDFNILHQDDRLVVVSKPSGLLSVPGRVEKDCMEARVRAQFSDARTVHRLDMDTSGVLLYARDAEAHKHLGLQFEQRRTQKLYIALVWGHVRDDEGVVDLPLRCDWPNRPRQMVDHDLGKPSQTHYQVLDRYEDANGHVISRVALKPITGRSHQLRVHMLALGYPILGDNLYAHDDALTASSRLMLHAQELSFFHPDDEHLITCYDEAPY